MPQSNRPARDVSRARRRAPALLLGAAALLAAAGCSGPPRTIDIGQRIHHDDFEYSVAGVDQADTAGDVRAAGRYWLVTFQVENRALRVQHIWQGAIAVLEDEEGRRYEHDARAERALAQSLGVPYRDVHETHAGETERTTLVFDVPRPAAHLFLRVRGEFLMGDLFDGRQYARTRVKLF